MGFIPRPRALVPHPHWSKRCPADTMSPGLRAGRGCRYASVRLGPVHELRARGRRRWRHLLFSQFDLDSLSNRKKIEKKITSGRYRREMWLFEKSGNGECELLAAKLSSRASSPNFSFDSDFDFRLFFRLPFRLPTFFPTFFPTFSPTSE